MGILKRYFFYGLGIGILFSTLVAHTAAKADDPSPLSKLDVEQWVKENDYRLLSQREWEQFESIQEPDPKTITVHETSIYILAGMTSRDVGRLLTQAELITDGEQFHKVMEERDMENEIRAGLYTFLGDPSLDEVIGTITNERVVPDET